MTQALWEAVMGKNPSGFIGNRLPVECVSFDDCQEFIRKLNAQTGQEFRLPTNAEWEYAARGGKQSRGYMYSGSNNLGSVAWYTDNSNRSTHPVKTKQSNELGLYDMSGNVWEWCQNGDSFRGARCVIRGGGWKADTRICLESLTRNFITSSSSRVKDYGLRLAL